VRAILRRILQLFVVLVVVTAFVSVLLEFLPGDPTTSIAPFATDEQRQIIREDAGLDDPLPVRYAQWLGDFVTGDLGNYYRGPTVTDPVSDDVWNGFGVSLQFIIYLQIHTFVLAKPHGKFSAYRATTLIDKAANAGAFAFK
jgi:peptide/nickel transport system permease protein